MGEVLKRDRPVVQTTAVDVWSSGVTMLQMIIGNRLLSTNLGPGATGLSAAQPHEANMIKMRRLHDEIRRLCPLSDGAKPGIVSDSCWGVFKTMLVPDVCQRATLTMSLRHAWLDVELPKVTSTNEEKPRRRRIHADKKRRFLCC